MIALLLSALFANQDVKVRLFHGQQIVPIQGPSFQINDQYEFQGGLHIRYDGKWRISQKKDTITLNDTKPILKIKFSKAKVFHRLVEDKIVLYWNRKRGGIDVIYPISMDKYFLGVLPAEMPASWPIEALKAQVIASKSYLLSQFKEKSHLHYDVEASVMDQVYDKERFLALSDSYKKKIRQAVAASKDYYIKAGSSYLKAYFHSHCGGFTENPKKVWNDRYAWKGRRDPFCRLNKGSKWTYRISKQDFSKQMATYFNEQQEVVKKIVTGNKNRSGRVDNIFIFFSNGRIRRISTQDLRKQLGFSNLKSTKLTLSLDQSNLYFRGLGYGHGVGMCQHGAKKMALLGESFDAILSFYYPHAKLVKIENNQTLIADH